MYEKNEEDIRFIEEWLKSQKFLPKDLSRHIICTFLLGCEGDRTKTKKVISNYFYARQSIPELFTRRDPLLRENLLAWKSSCFLPLKEKQDGCRVYLGAATNTENFEYVSLVKQMFMCFDLLIKNNEWGNGDRILILSYDKVGLQNMATYTHYITGKTAECERDNYLPGKLRAVHNVHIPPFMKKIHERFQPHLKPEDEKQVFFHKTLRSLYKFIRPEILPLEFGGRAGPLKILAGTLSPHFGVENADDSPPCLPAALFARKKDCTVSRESCREEATQELAMFRTEFNLPRAKPEEKLSVF